MSSSGTLRQRILVPIPKHATIIRGGGGEKKAAGNVTLPCMTRQGAMEDYMTVVLKYDGFSGPLCWYFAPDALKRAHREYVIFAENHVPAVAKAIIHTQDSISRDFTRPLRVLMPCTRDNNKAITDYVKIVCEYETAYAGRQCWSLLSADLQALHRHYVSLIRQALARDPKFTTRLPPFAPPTNWFPIPIQQ